MNDEYYEEVIDSNEHNHNSTNYQQKTSIFTQSKFAKCPHR